MSKVKKVPGQRFVNVLGPKMANGGGGWKAGPHRLPGYTSNTCPVSISFNAEIGRALVYQSFMKQAHGCGRTGRTLTTTSLERGAHKGAR